MISDGFLEFVQTPHAALTAGAQELAAHLVVGDLGDENGDASREESFKPLYGLGVDLLGVRVGDQPQRARVQQDDVRMFHLTFGGLRQILVREVLAILGTVAVEALPKLGPSLLVIGGIFGYPTSREPAEPFG